MDALELSGNRIYVRSHQLAKLLLMDVSPKNPVSADMDPPTISKNQLKKLKRDQEWEENRAKRKAKRKEKLQEKKQRKRAAREEANPTIPAPLEAAQGTSQDHHNELSKQRKRPQYEQVPVTLILDCGFDDMMIEKERKSLGSQITRCYSDNHKAPYQAHLAVSSFGGHLKERFDGLLAGHYQSWKNVRFLEGDFVEVAAQATEWMRGDCGGKLAGVFANNDSPARTLEENMEDGEVVYLTSDSPHTLTELRPYSTYIIGGLVDRNRHKGICYKRAMDRGIKTAKLPIGDYMQMTSRFVLATNHVAEIMVRWLELDDWGKAFLQVVPKRKGGVLKDGTGESGDVEVNEEADGMLNGTIDRADVESLESVQDRGASTQREIHAQATDVSPQLERATDFSACAEGAIDDDRKEGDAGAGSGSEDGGIPIQGDGSQ